MASLQAAGELHAWQHVPVVSSDGVEVGDLSLCMSHSSHLTDGYTENGMGLWLLMAAPNRA